MPRPFGTETNTAICDCTGGRAARWQTVDRVRWPVLMATRIQPGDRRPVVQCAIAGLVFCLGLQPPPVGESWRQLRPELPLGMYI